MENLSEPYIRKVNFYETDKMGIAHHSNYVRWFEEARLDFMDKNNLNYRHLEDLGIIIPVHSFSCQHKKPIRFDDRIAVSVKPKNFNGVRMAFEYEVRFCSDDTISAIGETTHFFVNSNNNLNEHIKPMNLKKKFPEVFEKLKVLF